MLGPTLLAALRGRRNFEPGRPADGAAIAALERSLGVRLPDDYREFLRAFGFAWWSGEAVYGIQPAAEAEGGYDYDAARQTAAARAYAAVPADGLVIGDDDMGGYYVLRCHTGRVELTGEDPGGAPESWPSFAAYLAEKVASGDEDD